MRHQQSFCSPAMLPSMLQRFWNRKRMSSKPRTAERRCCFKFFLCTGLLSECRGYSMCSTMQLARQARLAIRPGVPLHRQVTGKRQTTGRRPGLRNGRITRHGVRTTGGRKHQRRKRLSQTTMPGANGRLQKNLQKSRAKFQNRRQRGTLLGASSFDH